MAPKRIPGITCLFQGDPPLAEAINKQGEYPVGTIGLWDNVLEADAELEGDGFPSWLSDAGPQAESDGTPHSEDPATESKKPFQARSATPPKLIAVDVAHLMEICDQMEAAGVQYLFGGKASLHAEISSIKAIDCSGFVRYAMYNASVLCLDITDGSINQEAWCKNYGLTEVDYKKEGGLRDGKLRIAFMHGEHVWFVLDGQTIESSRTGGGPKRLAWDRPKLANVSKCYRIT
jgi:hypothetical protein